VVLTIDGQFLHLPDIYNRPYKPGQRLIDSHAYTDEKLRVKEVRYEFIRTIY